MIGWPLKAAQRRALERELHGTLDAALLRRVLALLEVDAGSGVAEAARQLQVDRRTVYRWLECFAMNGRIESLSRKPRPGRPMQWDEELEALLASALAQRPADFGYVATAWSVPLLQQVLSALGQELSATTLRRRLHELGYVWKRFRYVLAPDPELEKKTLAAASNQGLERSHGTPGAGRNLFSCSFLHCGPGGLGAESQPPCSSPGSTPGEAS